MPATIFDERQEFCLGRLNNLRQLLEGLDREERSKECCVYVVGSYARDEATIHSDLDAFLVASPAKGKSIPRVMEAHLVSALASAQKDMGLPDFTDGGEFLEVHLSDNMVGNLGHSEDDYKNTFTARMLLLLESKCIFNEAIYHSVIRRVVQNYFKDFHKHSSDFQPTFLMNDILRFWRTLCLNYEHGRQWRVESDASRAKGHLQNYKLKFSRLLTCFSTVALLLSKAPGVEPDDVIGMLKLSPMRRLQMACEHFGSLNGDLEAVQQEYAWFLSSLASSKDETRAWIMNEENRVEAFDHASAFCDRIYNIVRTIADERNLARFLVI